jgi:phosphoserine phosphatase
MLRFRTVIFDCDSTLSTLEGIDELARGHGAEVADLTAQAMEGRLRLEEVYGRRLDLVRPGRDALDRVGSRYIEHLVPGAAETVRRLVDAGVDVWVLSAGLAPAVRMLARHLGIPDHRVGAVEVRFDEQGGYGGYDHQSPLTSSGGKRRWIEDRRAQLVRPIMMVGDGVTDLETAGVVDLFVAFTGVARREAVVKQAGRVVEGPGLEEVASLVLG